jgi:hypothetical protein
MLKLGFEGIASKLAILDSGLPLLSLQLCPLLGAKRTLPD